MEFRKTALMNLCSGQQWRHKQRTDLQTQQLGEEGGGGTKGESNMEAYTLSCVKWITNGNLLYDSGNSNQGSVQSLSHVQLLATPWTAAN